MRAGLAEEDLAFKKPPSYTLQSLMRIHKHDYMSVVFHRLMRRV